METRTRKFKKTPLIWIGLLALLGAVYFIFDPMEVSWMPKCMFHTVTGWDCPGCGSQRAIHALLHGEIGEAFRANGMLLVMIPLLVLIAFTELRGNPEGRLFRFLHRPRFIIAIAGVILAWWIARNLI